MKKTVLHIFSGDLWAGAEVMIYTLLKNLKYFSDIEIIAISMNEGELSMRLRDEDIEVHVINEQMNSFSSIILKLIKLLKGKKIDIIHSHRYKENLLAFLTGKILGISRLITTVHGLPEGYSNSYPTLLKARLDYLILKKFFSTVVSVSKDMRSLLTIKWGFNPEKIRVIYNGIDTDKFYTSKKISFGNSFFHIGTAGRLVPVKGYELFLEIASEIRKKIRGVKFSILGDGPMREVLKDRATKLGLDGTVEFKGHSVDPLAYYQSLDLFINTSVHEGIPMSILEAMACGVPVIAAEVGGIPEIIRSGIDGFLLPREKDAFVKACLELIKRRELLLKMSEHCRRRVQFNFSARRMAEKYRDLYLTNG